MKTIGICACYDSRNYGSMLQTFATLQQIENMGFNYEIINYTKKLTFDLLIRSIGRIPDELMQRFALRKERKELAKYPVIISSLDKRSKCFTKYIEEHFSEKLSAPSDTFAQLRIQAKKYEAVMVGSDQLWTPRGYSTGFYNLMFVPDEITKISYATSFGVSSIPENKRVAARKFLRRIDFISVREIRASEIVYELIDRKVPTVVDPTLLFNSDQWDKLIEKKDVISEFPYIFCYFLGNNPSQREEVKKLKKETGYKIVFIPHLDEFIESDVSFGDIQLFDVGPNEFVNLIRNAEYICTDSFHGSVFSILNHKQFITFNRFKDSDSNSRNSRIDSLLSQTELKDRRFNGDLISQMQQPIDFEKVECCLEKMRKKSNDFLNNVMKNLKEEESYNANQ